MTHLGQRDDKPRRLAIPNMTIKKRTRPAKLKLGLRDKHKADKLQHIRSAAATSFTELGYETATMRTIANRAGVALGTIFLYAKDKRDLVFLIFNDELDGIVERAFGSVKSEMPFVEQLVSVFAKFYTHFAKNPSLSRILLKELTFISDGIHAKQLQERRRNMMRKIEELVVSAQKSGTIRSQEDPAFIARHIFLVFAGAIRWWFASETLERSAGIAELGRHFQLLMAGLDPVPPALGTQESQPRISPGRSTSRA